jgi:hypothetical protein
MASTPAWHFGCDWLAEEQTSQSEVATLEKLTENTPTPLAREPHET